MRSSTAVILIAAAASVAPTLAAPIAFSSDLQLRNDFDSLEVRDFENTFSRREFEEEMYARAVDEELVARSKIGRKIGHFFKKIGKGIMHVVGAVLKREDMDVFARELGVDEDVFAREFDGLVARNFDDDDVLFARDFDEELFARAFDEELAARDFNENRFVARAFGVDEQLVARSKIGRKIGHFFKKIGKGIMHVASAVLKREDGELVMRELGVDDELLARASFGPYAQLEDREFDDDLYARAFDEFDDDLLARAFDEFDELD
ncbi:hypothetical protein FOMPIDRAFT_1054857 [Fomitopsis schrenkii]|uniref:Uncharacterized protein n=1 Tax=Fomitopsis schrenkii TaxID=2126942 RepID=S8DPX4_FOMSC|nr:hypothetical protein FOMPIDRAFT_1054857 [Fomitopsis schrenkii]